MLSFDGKWLAVSNSEKNGSIGYVVSAKGGDAKANNTDRAIIYAWLVAGWQSTSFFAAKVEIMSMIFIGYLQAGGPEVTANFCSRA